MERLRGIVQQFRQFLDAIEQELDATSAPAQPAASDPLTDAMQAIAQSAPAMPLFAPDMGGDEGAGLAPLEEPVPQLPTPQPGARKRKIYRVAYHTGAALPGIPLESCCGPSRSHAEALKTGIELARPGWKNLLRVIEVEV